MQRTSFDLITRDIDLSRIHSIPLSEKFTIVEYIKYIAKKADYARSHGIKTLRKEEEFGRDSTFRLMIALVIEGATLSEIQEISDHYLENFKHSDIYYAKFAVVSIGAMMIKEGYSGGSIFNVLLSLLGVEFLTSNLKHYGYQLALDTEPEISSIIRYKEYEEKYRTTKYQLLALGMMYKNDGVEAVQRWVRHVSEDDELKLFFRMFDSTNEYLLTNLHNNLQTDGEDYSHMIITGVISLIRGENLMVSHYMMNSVIGKYSHFDQRPEKVEKEVLEVYAKMKEELKAV